jgi:hypothetical protein
VSAAIGIGAAISLLQYAKQKRDSCARMSSAKGSLGQTNGERCTRSSGAASLNDELLMWNWARYGDANGVPRKPAAASHQPGSSHGTDAAKKRQRWLHFGTVIQCAFTNKWDFGGRQFAILGLRAKREVKS